MLSCEGVTKGFGGVLALADVDLAIRPGEVVGLIGPNGSGKSTLVNVISGYLRPDRGHVRFADRMVDGIDPAELRRRGLSRTFQNLRLYRELTVTENLLIGLHLLYAGWRDFYWAWAGALVGAGRARRRDAEARAIARSALEEVDLAAKADARAGSLSYGEQKRLELARASLLGPRLIVMDEPTAGLSPGEASDLMQRFSAPIRGSEDRALLVAEHHLELVLRVCTRVVVLNSGRTIMDGLPEEVATNEEVVRVYVGE